VFDLRTATIDIPASVEPSFEPYGRLIKMLLPSLSGVVVHDGFANLIWASDDWSLAETHQLVTEAIENALADPAPYPAILQVVDDDTSAYSFALRGERTDLLGVVSIALKRSGAQQGLRPVPYVRQLVQPVLECLARELNLRSTLGSRERDLDVRERDLELVFEMSSQEAAPANDADEFDLLLKTGLERLGCALAALWVPDKGIAVSATRSGQPLAPGLIERAEQHLMAWMQLQQRTIMINRIARLASEAAAPYKILACPIRHPSARVMGVLALFNPPSAEDFEPNQARIAELLAKRATAVIQANYDSSTGLMTRPAFERQVNLLASKEPGTQIDSILYLDIDRMHVINETFGMHFGDDIIIGVADCLAKTLPKNALSARISGDRLAALIPNTSLEDATLLAEQIRLAATAIVTRAAQTSVEISVSIGISPLNRTEDSLAHALATAEIACKAAKDRGRNRVEKFQDSDQSIIRRHTDLMIIGKLRGALDDDSFRLDAQPILPLRGSYGRPRFELLLRMVSEDGEIIPPGKFLHAADRYQLMPAIDRWVVRQACELLGRHRNIIGEDSARFAINLSGQSLRDEGFLDFVVEQIQASGIVPGILCFELTETATIGNLSDAQAFMRRLQDLGCQFALDDFGTGVSSLAYLKDLSVNYLKIDGSFVRDIIDNPRSESMVKAIAQLAKVMCMETIAEYVETDALRSRVADLGVDYGQGFAMGKAQRFEDLLNELAIYEATVNTWVSEEASTELGSSGLLEPQ
jgi:diguanylate cyclase (GGDEF)-like protein